MNFRVIILLYFHISGAFGHIEQEEGSGGGFFPTDDEDSYPQIPYHVPEVDIFSHTSTSTSTTTTTEKTRPTPPPYIPKESTYEGKFTSKHENCFIDSSCAKIGSDILKP